MPGIPVDGGGLWTCKSEKWVPGCVLFGRPHETCLGAHPSVTVKEVRDSDEKWRAGAHEGPDAIEDRQRRMAQYTLDARAAIAPSLVAPLGAVTYVWVTLLGGGDQRRYNLAAVGASTPAKPKFSSHSDPAGEWIAACQGPAIFAQSNNHLIDSDQFVIANAEATARNWTGRNGGGANHDLPDRKPRSNQARMASGRHGLWICGASGPDDKEAQNHSIIPLSASQSTRMVHFCARTLNGTKKMTAKPAQKANTCCDPARTLLTRAGKH